MATLWDRPRTTPYNVTPNVQRPADSPEYRVTSGKEAELESIYGDIAGAQGAERGALSGYVDRAKGLEGVLGPLFRQNEEAFAQSGRVGQRAVTREAARAMAGGMGQAGAMPIGGGGAALLRQQGLESGQRRAEFGAQQSLAEAQLKSQQAMTMEEAMMQSFLGQAEAQQHISTMQREEGERRTARMQEIQNTIAGLKDKYSNPFETDTRAVARDLSALAATESDPQVREYILAEALRIRSTPMNMFTIE